MVFLTCLSAAILGSMLVLDTICFLIGVFISHIGFLDYILLLSQGLSGETRFGASYSPILLIKFPQELFFKQ